MMFAPLVSFDTVTRPELNACLRAWRHRMGEWQRPQYGPEMLHGLRHGDDLVAVTASAGLIRETCAGFGRHEAFELGRVCASQPALCRAILRLWREFVFPAACRAHGWRWVVSYQDATLHRGHLYRLDGWVRVGTSRSGTDPRGGRRGRSKVIWAWNADEAARAEARARAADGVGRGGGLSPQHAAFLSRFVARGWLAAEREDAAERRAIEAALRLGYLRRELREAHFTPAGRAALAAFPGGDHGEG